MLIKYHPMNDVLGSGGKPARINLALDGGDCRLYALAALPPGTGTRWIEG